MHEALTRQIKERARALGFDDVGIAPARPGAHADALDAWLARGHAAGMAYLARDPGKRKDPCRVLPGASSVVVCARAYAPPDGASGPGTGIPPDRAAIARFARGRDYHLDVGEGLAELLAFIREKAPEPVEGRAYVDTGPILEREAAALAGLGRFGKNSSLIHPSLGSCFFLGVILVTLELEPDAPLQDDPCGACRRCLDACPTGALCAPYDLDARRCLSYLTIEHRGALPPEARDAMGNRVFGCDACQDVCPWNRRLSSQPRESSSLPGTPPLLGLLSLDALEFARRYRETPVKRAKLRGLRRNVTVALGNSGDTAAVPALTGLLRDPDPLLRGHAAWALGRLGTPDALAALAAALSQEDDLTVQDEIRAALVTAEHAGE